MIAIGPYLERRLAPPRCASSPLKGYDGQTTAMGQHAGSVGAWINNVCTPHWKLQGRGDKSANGANPIRLPTEGVTIGTWNVRTLHQCSRVNELTNELKQYQWDIIGLAEACWAGFREITTDEGHKIWYSRDSTKHQHSIAMFVKNEAV